MYVAKKDMTSRFKIKAPADNQRVRRTHQDVQGKIALLSLGLNDVSIDDVMEHLKESKKDQVRGAMCKTRPCKKMFSLRILLVCNRMF